MSHEYIQIITETNSTRKISEFQTKETLRMLTRLQNSGTRIISQSNLSIHNNKVSLTKQSNRVKKDMKLKTNIPLRHLITIWFIRTHKFDTCGWISRIFFQLELYVNKTTSNYSEGSKTIFIQLGMSHATKRSNHNQH